MKPHYLTIPLLALLIFSCNKSHDTGSNYTINCTLDGTSKNFTGNVFATKTSDNHGNSININGLLATASGEGLDVLISSNNPSRTIDQGTYADTSTVYTLLLAYAPSVTGTGYSGGTATSDTAATHGITVANRVKVTITSISGVEIKGTFSGDVFLSGDPSGDKKTIANGSFDAKFQ